MLELCNSLPRSSNPRSTLFSLDWFDERLCLSLFKVTVESGTLRFRSVHSYATY